MRILDVSFRCTSELDHATLLSSRQSPAVVEVSPDTDALVAARMASEHRAGLIVVADGDDIRGVLAPAIVLQRIAAARRSQPSNLEHALTELLHDPEEQRRNFQHEWLNSIRPDLFVCSTGPHYTDEWPCKYHGG
jgi:hypothetical protein